MEFSKLKLSQVTGQATLTRYSVLSTLKTETALKIEIRVFEAMGESDKRCFANNTKTSGTRARVASIQSHERFRRLSLTISAEYSERG